MIKIQIDRDGDSWIAHYGDFTNPQESPVGCGSTPEEAVNALFDEDEPTDHLA